MKKLIALLSLLFLLGEASLAQEQIKTAKPKISANDLLLCDKNWTIVSVEEWGVVTKPPAERNKNDKLNLSQDGKYSLVMHGEPGSGTWTKSGQWIYFTDAATKKKMNFKVLLAETNKLKVDHYSDEEGHSIFEYEAK